jgi:hypothetical protein
MAVLDATGGVPVVDALDAATCRLEAVISGLRELMNISECSDQATLVFYAAESALALVYAGHAGIEAAYRAPQKTSASNRGAAVEGVR